MSQETLARLRRGYEAFNRGDASVAIALSTPDVEWGATGAFPGVEGLYRGPGAIQEWMAVIRSAWEEFEVSLDEVLRDQGDDLLVVAERLRGRGRGSGAEVEMCVFSAHWFEAGKIRRRAAFTERKAALEAAAMSEAGKRRGLPQSADMRGCIDGPSTERELFDRSVAERIPAVAGDVRHQGDAR